MCCGDRLIFLEINSKLMRIVHSRGNIYWVSRIGPYLNSSKTLSPTDVPNTNSIKTVFQPIFGCRSILYFLIQRKKPLNGSCSHNFRVTITFWWYKVLPTSAPSLLLRCWTFQFESCRGVAENGVLKTITSNLWSQKFSCYQEENLHFYWMWMTASSFFFAGRCAGYICIMHINL